MTAPSSLSARARAAEFCTRFGLRAPILMAPMAGSCPPALAAAVANGGGMGAMGADNKKGGMPMDMMGMHDMMQKRMEMMTSMMQMMMDRLPASPAQ